MQNAQTLVLNTVNALIKENEIEKALDTLSDLNDKTSAGIGDDLTIQYSNFRSASKEKRSGGISFEEYRRYESQVKSALLDIMDEVKRKMERDAPAHNTAAYHFELPDGARLEKLLGKVSNLLTIEWLEKARAAANAVCRVVCADGNLGTGFLTKDGYLFTNHHVIGTAEIAKTARIEFNYETGKSVTSYTLDATDFKTSTPDQLDFTRVKVVDRNDAPLSKWGYVEFDTESLPIVGEDITVIQHPKGQVKQFKTDAVLGQYNQYLLYTTETEPGSSGSPVLNKDCKVIAIHHAGKTDAEGGLQINARGDKKGANRGILFREIMAYVNGGKAPAANTGSTGNESFLDPTPTITPTPAIDPTITPTPTPTPTPPSATPKFMVVYDEADTNQCTMLNKHLNVLKLTKKIKVYNVHEGQALGSDPLLRAQEELADTDYIIALITVNLTSSADWLGMLLEALAAGRRIIPVRIEKADVDGTGLEKMKSLPTQGRSISDFPTMDAAYTDVVTELKKLLPK